MLGVPMGWVNSPVLFQNRLMEEVLQPQDLYLSHAIQWIDDTLLYGTDSNDYLDALSRFLSQIEEKGLRLNVDKCDFATDKVVWCGREITPDGWTFEQKFYKKILEIPKPQYVHEMAQVIYLANWLSPQIPEFSKLRDKLHDAKEFMGKRLKALER